MRRNMFIYIMVIIITIIFIYAFSSSYTSKNMNNIAYVTAIGIDLNDDDKNLNVTFEFMDMSAFSSEKTSKSSEPILDSVVSSTISNALNMINSYTGKEVNLSHCKVIVFSEEIAKKGIMPELTELMNNIEVRPTANLIVTKSTAVEYLQKSVSKLEKVLTKYYDVFVNSGEYTGYTSDIQIGKFYNYLIDEDCNGCLAILGGLNEESLPDSEEIKDLEEDDDESKDNNNKDSEESSINNEIEEEKNVSVDTIIAGNSPIVGQRGTENMGLSVFNNDKYIADLSIMETLCYTLITGEVDSFLITLNDENNNINVELIENIMPKINIDITKENPIINIYIKVNGKIIGMDKIDQNTQKQDLNQFSKKVNEYLENEIKNYLTKTSTDFKCDINGFYKYAKQKFLTNIKWKDYNWNEKYLKSEFNICVDSQIYSSIVN